MGASAPPHASFLVAPVRRREATHRRHVLLAIAALITLSATPVFGHHLAAGGAALLEGHDHVLGICLIAMHLLLQPVHTASHLLVLAGLGYAAWDRARAWLGVRAALRGLQPTTPAPGSPFANAAAVAEVPLGRIRVVPALTNPAFTVGWWRPNIYVARELGDLLSPDELAAVLAHEGAHLARRDPLLLSSLRFLACTLFFLPALRRLAADSADASEIAADDVAAELSSERAPLALASAIVRIATQYGRLDGRIEADAFGRSHGVAGFQRVDLLERRVRRLVSEEVAVGTHVTRRSLTGAAMALGVIWISGLIMAHPLPPEHGGAQDAASHCAHHRVALTHLFCLGLHAHRSAGSPCPHAGQ